MTPEGMAALVGRWVRFYTRDLPAPIAGRRVDEIGADLHDHIEHERANGTSDRRIALAVLSRMVRGVAADVSWRDERARAISDRPTTPGGPMKTHEVISPVASRERPPSVTILAILAAVGGVGAVLGVIAGSFIHGLDSLDAVETVIVLAALGMAVLYLAFAYAAWNLKPWGWSLGLVAGIASIVLTTAVLIRGWADLTIDAPPFAVLGVLVVVIAAAALFFWFRPEVKAAFERA
jgi:hypothetical protein